MKTNRTRMAMALGAVLLTTTAAHADALTLGKLRSAYASDPSVAMRESHQYITGSINTMDALVIDRALNILSITYDLSAEQAINRAFDMCLDRMPNAEGMLQQIVRSEYKDELPVTIAILQQYKRTCREWMP